MEPRSMLKQTKVRKQYRNGLAVGDTTLTGEALTNIASVAEMDESDLAAIKDAAELAAAVGTYEGEDDIVTDLSALQTAVGTYAGAADIVTDLSALQVGALLDYNEDTETGTYTYDATPTEAVAANIPDTNTCAVITPGGATAHALTFTLPTPVSCNVFKVTYDLGTHTGTVTIGGQTITGSGVLHFFWVDDAWVTWTTNALALTIPDRCSLVSIELTDAGSSNAITLTMPTGASNVGHEIPISLVLSADSGTACTANLNGLFLEPTGAAGNQEDVANGGYLMRCVSTGAWMPIKSDAIGHN